MAVVVGAIKQTSISQVMFSERDISIVKGTTVIWENLDPFDHTVTSESGVFDSGRFSNREKFEFDFSELGTFGYICTIHTNMDGFVTVYEEGSPTPVPTVMGDQKMSPGYSY
jgi:plastocyanin